MLTIIKHTNIKIIHLLLKSHSTRALIYYVNICISDINTIVMEAYHPFGIIKNSDISDFSTEVYNIIISCINNKELVTVV